MKILIVEDDDLCRLILEAILIKLGHEVTVTMDGKEALALVQKQYFPVVISDWLMPHLDGPGLCEAIRRKQQSGYTYIILLTSLGGKNTYLEGMKAGADDFMTKPVDEEQLAARLHVAARIVGLRHQLTTLEGLLPICSYCKKIRDEKDEWEEIESYVSRSSGSLLTHGVCPGCAEKMILELDR